MKVGLLLKIIKEKWHKGQLLFKMKINSNKKNNNPQEYL
jgi:hypothetical protein